MSVVIETTQGDLTVDLFLKERPKTCLNFLKLCKTKAYNLNLFHTVQPDFIAQTGDPSGTGRGGESVFCQLYGEQVWRSSVYYYLFVLKVFSLGKIFRVRDNSEDQAHQARFDQHGQLWR